MFCVKCGKEVPNGNDTCINCGHKVGEPTDIKELTPEILRTFISKIVIHERSRKHAKDAEQDIDIYFAHIGNLNRFCTDGQATPTEITA